HYQPIFALQDVCRSVVTVASNIDAPPSIADLDHERRRNLAAITACCVLQPLLVPPQRRIFCLVCSKVNVSGDHYFTFLLLSNPASNRTAFASLAALPPLCLANANATSALHSSPPGTRRWAPARLAARSA